MNLPIRNYSMPRCQATSLLVLVAILSVAEPALSQGRHSDVIVTVMKDKIVALSAGGSGGKNHSE